MTKMDSIPEPRARRRAVDTNEDAPVAKNGALSYVTVRRTSYAQDQETTDTVRVPVFHAHPARVRVSGGVTVNMGDFNSARVDVTIEMPCLPEESEVVRTYDMVSEWVNRLVCHEEYMATGAVGQQRAQHLNQGDTGSQQPSGPGAAHGTTTIGQ